ncbi:hypothetical protein [Streptomyces sp. NPDC059783]|uniref:hypothetical protein n=1 Tax=Streptomyces sp. NPDC059783 TaxID=3346944 RepID=UPI00365FCB10
MKVFGFAQNDDGTSDFAPLPDTVAEQVESTRTLSDGESWTDPATGDTYTTTKTQR